jgi:hypothetical protein
METKSYAQEAEELWNSVKSPVSLANLLSYFLGEIERPTVDRSKSNLEIEVWENDNLYAFINGMSGWIESTREYDLPIDGKPINWQAIAIFFDSVWKVHFKISE